MELLNVLLVAVLLLLLRKLFWCIRWLWCYHPVSYTHLDVYKRQAPGHQGRRQDRRSGGQAYHQRAHRCRSGLRCG